MRTFSGYLIHSKLGWTSIIFFVLFIAGWFQAMAMFDHSNLISQQQPEGNLAEALAATMLLISSQAAGAIAICLLIVTMIRFFRTPNRD